jgi:hypothetical protein
VIEPDGRLRHIVRDKFHKGLKQLAAVAERLRSSETFRRAAKSIRAEALTQDARVAHGPNINSACESCGKPKATAFPRFSLRQRLTFSLPENDSLCEIAAAAIFPKKSRAVAGLRAKL